jgi:predicted ribosome quality control (RQC) complex YloA/Tae2 family protein
MELTVNVYLHTGDQVVQKLDSIIGFLTASLTQGNLIMSTLQDAADVIDALPDLVQQTHNKIDDLQAEIQKLAAQDPEQQALIDRIIAKAKSIKDGLIAARDDNDPQSPGTEPVPAPEPTPEPAPETPAEPPVA